MPAALAAPGAGADPTAAAPVPQAGPRLVLLPPLADVMAANSDPTRRPVNEANLRLVWGMLSRRGFQAVLPADWAAVDREAPFPSVEAVLQMTQEGVAAGAGGHGPELDARELGRLLSRIFKVAAGFEGFRPERRRGGLSFYPFAAIGARAPAAPAPPEMPIAE